MGLNLRVQVPVGQLRRVEVGHLAHGDVRAQRVVLADVGALVQGVHVVEEGRLATAARTWRVLGVPHMSAVYTVGLCGEIRAAPQAPLYKQCI